MIKYLKSVFKSFLRQEFDRLRKDKLQDVETMMIQNGRIWAAHLPKEEVLPIQEAEFKVFSQGGDDGIIQYLIAYLDIKKTTFVEFGVEDYTESNTRFLLMNNNWTGLIMDGTEENIRKIKSSPFYWKHDLIAKHAFITSENVNTLIEEENFTGEIGLLHIDIDGNDYWIMKAIKIIKPIIIIIEYNSVFGKDRSITVPYRKDFNRSKAHFSNLYFGASISALYELIIGKGYIFIGCNSLGNNAYFVKKINSKNLKPLNVEEGFVLSKFRESRNELGGLNFLRGSQRFDQIKGFPVLNTQTGKIEKL